MQEPAKPKKTKVLVLAVIVIALVIGLLMYFPVSRQSPFPSPLDYGSLITGHAYLYATVNETYSCGFSLWNRGVVPITMEKINVNFSNHETELVEAVFYKVVNHKFIGSLIGTPEENGYITFPFEGHIIEADRQAQMSISIKASTLGNHTVTDMTFTYSYLGWRYSFVYKIEGGFSLLVKNEA